MTDTTAPETEVSTETLVADHSADDAKYAAMEEKYGSKPEPKAEPEPHEAPEQIEAKDKPERAPLAPEELEKRNEQRAIALKQERQRRQELERRLAELEAKQAPQKDEFEDFLTRLREDDEDPIEDIQGLKQVVRHFLNQQKAEAEAARTQTQQQTAYQRFMSSVAEAEAEFREEAGDYDDAQSYFKESLKKELTGLGLEGDELNQEFARQVTNVAQQALNRGKNPAQVVYELAKLRGYAVAQAKQPATTQQEAPQVKQEVIDKAAETIEKLAKTQQASRSLSSVGGASAGSGELTLTQVNKLKGRAFLDGMQKLREQAKRTGTYF